MEADSNSSEENPLGSILGGAKLVLIGRFIKMGVVFGAQVILARFLGSTSFGGLIQTLAVGRVASIIGGLGLGSGVTRQFAYYEDEPEKARGILQAAILLGLTSTGIVAILLYWFAPMLSNRVFNDPNLSVYFRIIAIGLPFGFLSSIAISVAKASRDASTHVYINQLMNPILKSIMKAGLVLLGFGTAWAVAGQVFATIVTMFVALFLAWRILPISIKGPSEPMKSNLLKFSLPLLVGSSMDFVLGDIDTFLLGILRPSADVGLYHAAFTLRPFVLVFFFPATFLLPPVLTRLQKEDRSTEARLTYQAISKWTTLASFPLFLLLFLFPEVVLRMAFSSEYVPASNALRVLSFSMLINVLLGANDRAVIALGHNRFSMYVNATSAITNVVLNYLFIPVLGILGAAVASGISFMSRDVINSAFLYNRHGLNPLSRSQIRSLGLASLIVSLGYIGFTNIFQVHFLTVSLIGIIFLAVYPLIIIRLGVTGQIDYEVFREFEEAIGIDLAYLRDTIKWIKSL